MELKATTSSFRMPTFTSTASWKNLKWKVSSEPLSSIEHVRQGTALESAGKCEQALECFRKACNLDSRNVEALDALSRLEGRLGRVALRDSDLEGALTHFLESKRCMGDATRIAPRDPNLHNNLGAVYIQLLVIERSLGNQVLTQGAWNLALGSLEKALELDPLAIEPHFNLGTAYEQMGMAKEALEHYLACFARSPNDEQVCLKIGEVYAEIAHSFEAADKLKEAIFNYTRAKQWCQKALLLDRENIAADVLSRAVSVHIDDLAAGRIKAPYIS